ncbi:class I SAM-dependent methyltransferase [Anabaena azotica]|uniref:class I SAM-dependent methyltransferase n=1 Tax=Anabaena azotica TaxID=197653 RepID=UPI0039A62855
MNQDSIFFMGEGDNWFNRNTKALENYDNNPTDADWVSDLIDLIRIKKDIKNILDLGCANGWRLNKVGKKLEITNLVGVDASKDAIQDGKNRYPHLSLYHSLLADIPIQDNFDLVLVCGVLCCIDRQSLAKSIAEIDRVTSDGGTLIIGDFLPDFQQCRKYHHLPEENIYTYKQDYSQIFKSMGIYREVARIACNYGQKDISINLLDSSSQWVFTVLQKSLQNFYPEVP